jgi:hypothetical protein
MARSLRVRPNAPLKRRTRTHAKTSELPAFVVPKGQDVTHALLLKLSNFSRAGTIDKELMVLVPG